MKTLSRIPELASDEIHIWSVHIPNVLEQLDALHVLLSKKEQTKVARFRREADYQSSVIARGALRILLSGYTGIPANKLIFQYSENGKPSLLPSASNQILKKEGSLEADRSISFNLSHSGDWVVLAFGRGGNMGVDVEKIRREMNVSSIALRYFTPEENAQMERAADPYDLFFKLWVRKEAYVKACGSTLFRELNTIAVPMAGTLNGWSFQGLEVDMQYAAAVVADKALGNVLQYDFGGLEWES